MIRYQESLAGIAPAHLTGFFVGWRYPPTPEMHHRLLAGSDRIVLAIDDESGNVVGFVTAITDGVLSGFIPLLEVLPNYQRQGIGHELMRRMLALLADLPNVDLLCDDDPIAFYERFGMISLPGAGMVLRRPLG